MTRGRLSSEARLRAACEWQLDLCTRNGSPTYATLIRSLIDRLGVESALTEMLAGDPQDPIQSALCLRLFGAVNRVAQADPSCPLRRYYPTLGGVVDLSRVVPAFFDVLTANLAHIRETLRTAVQTNEVGRAAPLSAAMNYVAAVTGTPLRLLEVGASAGLHLALNLAERHGCDRHPLDIHNTKAAELLRSFVWPEHVDRLRRLNAAIDIARAAPRLDIEAAEATDWVARKVTDLPVGYTTVVFHSIVLPYLDPDERVRLAETIRSAGVATDDTRPLAWISLEPTDEDSNIVQLSCEIWPGNRRVELAQTTPHGTRVRWAPRERSA